MTATLDLEAYDAYIESMRHSEYPMLRHSLYLDHAGSTLYSKRLMDRFHAEMMANLYANPHSASSSSQRSTLEVENVRLQVLHFLRADPNVFDVVFTPNTTAAIKLVAEAFRDSSHTRNQIFTYAYHIDSHTSLVGVRELADRVQCFDSDHDFASFIEHASQGRDAIKLAAYPAQSNMHGRRLPLEWCRKSSHPARTEHHAYTLLDAAAYAATSPLHFDDAAVAPDFTVLSFSKMFGFPDLGALLVKKDCAPLFQSRKYFGGGTVDMVVCLKESWHAKKSSSLHEQLEDGTLPVHSILSLRLAMQTHQELFGSMYRVREHTAKLAERLYHDLASLKHANHEPVCRIYKHESISYADSTSQGPTVAFNLRDQHGKWISNSEVEKLASVKDIHVRTGGLCNPGGIAACLQLEPWEMRENFTAGFRCGTEDDIINGKPTGVIRVSFGAMSTRGDVSRFVDFIQEFFVNSSPAMSNLPTFPDTSETSTTRLYVESLTVYPIKSCGGWQVPSRTAWDVRAEGLAWDREWCIVKRGTNVTLSQKAHPRMALIRPQLDLQNGLLRIQVTGSNEQISVPLSQDPTYFASPADFQHISASVCGDTIAARSYTSPHISDFLTRAIGVPCTLARFPAMSSAPAHHSTRHSKAHLHASSTRPIPRPILLSNESPILTISRSSLNRLNEVIKTNGGKAVYPAVFRANIVLAESPLLPAGREQPWAEDDWDGMRIGAEGAVDFDFLGGCRRCQMVGVDQESGEKSQEPLVTLAKTRRFGGRILFGVHTSLARGTLPTSAAIRVGDPVTTWKDAGDGAE